MVSLRERCLEGRFSFLEAEVSDSVNTWSWNHRKEVNVKVGKNGWQITEDHANKCVDGLTHSKLSIVSLLALHALG